MKKHLIKLAANIALKAAKSAAGSASEWNVYQPKEPQKVKKLVK